MKDDHEHENEMIHKEWTTIIHFFLPSRRSHLMTPTSSTTVWRDATATMNDSSDSCRYFLIIFISIVAAHTSDALNQLSINFFLSMQTETLLLVFCRILFTPSAGAINLLWPQLEMPHNEWTFRSNDINLSLPAKMLRLFEFIVSHRQIKENLRRGDSSYCISSSGMSWPARGISFDSHLAFKRERPSISRAYLDARCCSTK